MRSRRILAAFSRVTPAARLCLAAVAGLVSGFLVVWWFGPEQSKAPYSHLERARGLIDWAVKEWGEPPGLHVEYLYALSCMNYVHNSVRPARFDAFVKQGKFPPGADAETCFRLKAGLCGNQVQTFHELLSSFDLPIRHRSVEFYLHDEEHGQNRNHVVAEVYYAGGWHMFDVTAGAVFLRRGGKRQDDLLSADEMRAVAREQKPWQELIVHNAASTWCRLQAHSRVDIFEYLSWPETDLLHGRNGAITLHQNRLNGRYSLDNMIRTVGYSRDYNGNRGNASLRLGGSTLKDGATSCLELTVSNVWTGANAVLWITDGSTMLHEIPITEELKAGQVLRVPITKANGDLTLQIESSEADAALEFSEISLH